MSVVCTHVHVWLFTCMWLHVYVMKQRPEVDRKNIATWLAALTAGFRNSLCSSSQMELQVCPLKSNNSVPFWHDKHINHWAIYPSMHSDFFLPIFKFVLILYSSLRQYITCKVFLPHSLPFSPKSSTSLQKRAGFPVIWIEHSITDEERPGINLHIRAI